MYHKKQVLTLLTAGFFIISGVAWTSCGKFEVEVNPVKVDVTHHVTFEEVLVAFRAQCKRELGASATKTQIEDCAQDKLATFINDLGDALGG